VLRRSAIYSSDNNLDGGTQESSQYFIWIIIGVSIAVSLFVFGVKLTGRAVLPFARHIRADGPIDDGRVAGAAGGQNQSGVVVWTNEAADTSLWSNEPVSNVPNRWTAQHHANAEPMPPAAGGLTATNTIRELKKLLDEGVITEADFESKKKVLLDSLLTSQPVQSSAPTKTAYAPPASPVYHNDAPSAANGDGVYNAVEPAHSDDHYDWSSGSAARAARTAGNNSDLYGEMSPAKDDDDGYLDTAPGNANAAPDNAYLDTAPAPAARGKGNTATRGNTFITIGARCIVTKLGRGTVRFVGPIGIKVRRSMRGLDSVLERNDVL
jgi:hypothetical protein